MGFNLLNVIFMAQYLTTVVRALFTVRDLKKDGYLTLSGINMDDVFKYSETKVEISHQTQRVNLSGQVVYLLE